MTASRAGWVRKAMAHSTSAELCTSMSGSTTTTILGRKLLAIAASMALRASPAKRGCIAMTMRYDTPPDDGIDTFDSVGNCWRIIARNEAS